MIDTTEKAYKKAREARGYLELASYLPKGTKNRLKMVEKWAHIIQEMPKEYRHEAVMYSSVLFPDININLN